MTIIASTLRSESTSSAVEAARARLDAGFDALGLAAPLYREDWETLQPLLPQDCIIAVELFVPLPRTLRPGALARGKRSPFSLGSLHRESKRDAEKHGPVSISFAHHLGARYVLLPPIEESGGLGTGALRERPPGTAVGVARSPEAQAHLDSWLSCVARAACDTYQASVLRIPHAHCQLHQAARHGHW